MAPDQVESILNSISPKYTQKERLNTEPDREALKTEPDR
mgnify:CR=1 FL=1